MTWSPMLHLTRCVEDIERGQKAEGPVEQGRVINLCRTLMSGATASLIRMIEKVRGNENHILHNHYSSLDPFSLHACVLGQSRLEISSFHSHNHRKIKGRPWETKTRQCKKIEKPKRGSARRHKNMAWSTIKDKESINVVQNEREKAIHRPQTTSSTIHTNPTDYFLAFLTFLFSHTLSSLICFHLYSHSNTLILPSSLHSDSSSTGPTPLTLNNDVNKRQTYSSYCRRRPGWSYAWYPPGKVRCTLHHLRTSSRRQAIGYTHCPF
jgi:hypothetical protein